MKNQNSFTGHEFKCPCCGVQKMEEYFVYRLSRAREIARIPFKIVRGFGYRCQKYSESIGEGADDPHRKGLAVRIKVRNDKERWMIVQALLYAGGYDKHWFPRIGVGSDFIYVDDDATKPGPRLWCMED